MCLLKFLVVFTKIFGSIYNFYEALFSFSTRVVKEMLGDRDTLLYSINNWPVSGIALRPKCHINWLSSKNDFDTFVTCDKITRKEYN